MNTQDRSRMDRFDRPQLSVNTVELAVTVRRMAKKLEEIDKVLAGVVWLIGEEHIGNPYARGDFLDGTEPNHDDDE